VVDSSSAGGSQSVGPAVSCGVQLMVKAMPRLRSWQAMAACIHHYLVEGVFIAVYFHFTRVASRGNPRSRYPESNNGDVVGIAFPHEDVVLGISCGWWS
jgi:hypothetical protein